MESRMPARPDKSNHLISLLGGQTDAPHSGGPRNHENLCDVTTVELKTDLDKAREIVKKHVRFIRRTGMMHENIALAVAEGIALGRKQGIAMVAEAVSRLKSKNDA
jgi:hypothetical protein